MIITVVSKADFAGYVPSKAAAVLRIFDPNEEYSAEAAALSNSGWGDVKALDFWDMGMQGLKPVETLLVRVLGRWRGLCLGVHRRLYGQDPEIPFRPFLEADARDIAHFADRLPGKGIRHLMVVCGNGRARSWTIAHFLAKRLGASLTASHGWQRESAPLAAVLKRVPQKRAAVAAPGLSRLEAAE